MTQCPNCIAEKIRENVHRMMADWQTTAIMGKKGERLQRHYSIKYVD